MKNFIFFVCFIFLFLFIFSYPVCSKQEEKDTTGTVGKLRIDINGKHKTSVPGVSKTDNVETGLSLALESSQHTKIGVELGAGICYQIPRSLKNYSGSFWFVPLYGIIKIPGKERKGFFVGHLGYNLFYGDSRYTGGNTSSLSGGMYYGIGVESDVFKIFSIEALYSVNNGSYRYGSSKFDIEYSKISLSIGRSF